MSHSQYYCSLCLEHSSSIQLLGFHSKPTYSKMPFRIPRVALNSPFPTELRETHFYYSNYHSLVWALWYLCLGLDEPKFGGLRSHSLTIIGKCWCHALQGDNASCVFIWMSWKDYGKSSLKIGLVSKLCRVRILCSIDQEKGSLLAQTLIQL